MKSNEFDKISSEIKQLEKLLDKIPHDNVIERVGLESRLNKAKELISIATVEEVPYKAIITYKGNPVVGTHGIFADFAANATSAFSASILAIAASLSENLKYMGPIPNRHENQLLLTGTAKGSFGFEFEVPKINTDTLFPDASGSEQALEKFQSLLNFSIEGNDDELTELVQEIHPRAVGKVIDFLDILKTNHAWFGLTFKKKKFQFKNFQDVEASLVRLDMNNIVERDESYSGKFLGVLPASRTFEFETEGIVLKGKIGPDIIDPYILNTEYLGRNVTVILHATQVGEGKPRYILKDISHINMNN